MSSRHFRFRFPLSAYRPSRRSCVSCMSCLLISSPPPSILFFFFIVVLGLDFRTRRSSPASNNFNYLRPKATKVLAELGLLSLHGTAGQWDSWHSYSGLLLFLRPNVKSFWYQPSKDMPVQSWQTNKFHLFFNKVIFVWSINPLSIALCLYSCLFMSNNGHFRFRSAGPLKKYFKLPPKYLSSTKQK